MPSFRGVEISIVVQPESQPLPEFPHPDASSVHILSPDIISQSPRGGVSTYSGPDSPRIHKTNPRVSVYIPSIPGAQFCIQYSIHRPPEPLCSFFFKMLLNGRAIANWGTNPGASSGTVMRALYEPCDRWHFKQDGVLLKRSGIESRSFTFSPGPDATAAADDGGVIEIQVFRAKNRRRRTPSLSQYRGQEQYGIVSPSGGLLDHPEDAVYYDWVLNGPTDSPFASFHFNYRAWAYLLELNLVPDQACLPARLRQSPPEIGDQDKNMWLSSPKFQESGSRESKKDVVKNHAISRLSEHHNAHITTVPEPPERLHSQPQSSSDPLPEDDSLKLHVHNTVLYCSRFSEELLASEAASRRSLESYAPSIAPSLLPYIDGDSFSNDTEDVEYGTATEIPIRSDSLGVFRPGGRRPLPQLPSRRSSYASAVSSLGSPEFCHSQAFPHPASPECDALPAHYSSSFDQSSRFHDPEHPDLPLTASMTDLGLGTLELNEGEWMKMGFKGSLDCQGNHAQ